MKIKNGVIRLHINRIKIKVYDQIINEDKIKNVYKENRLVKNDKISISEKALDLKMIKSKLNEIPDVREEKIKTIKEAVQNGTYHVPSRVLARKLLEEMR
jgi:negative regulator of flagellin synthesis FlgM